MVGSSNEVIHSLVSHIWVVVGGRVVGVGLGGVWLVVVVLVVWGGRGGGTKTSTKRIASDAETGVAQSRELC